MSIMYHDTVYVEFLLHLAVHNFYDQNVFWQNIVDHRLIKNRQKRNEMLQECFKRFVWTFLVLNIIIEKDHFNRF